MIESGEVDADSSRIFYITDRSEDVNQYLKTVSITPLDIKQDQLKCLGTRFQF